MKVFYYFGRSWAEHLTSLDLNLHIYKAKEIVQFVSEFPFSMESPWFQAVDSKFPI